MLKLSYKLKNFSFYFISIFCFMIKADKKLIYIEFDKIK